MSDAEKKAAELEQAMMDSGRKLELTDPFDITPNQKYPEPAIEGLTRVCDGHSAQHCDYECYVKALEAEVRKLRKWLDDSSDTDVAQLELALETADTRIAVLERQNREFILTGWNEARAAKCRMLENWQVRFVNIMSQTREGAIERDDLAKAFGQLSDLMREMNWVK